MGHCIRLGDREVPYLLRRSTRRRSIGLRIDHAGLTVSVPALLAQSQWEAVLREKSGWVLDKLRAMREHAAPAFGWRDGQAMSFFGSRIVLSLVAGGVRARPVLCDGVLRVGTPTGDEMAIAHKVTAWYRREALSHFRARVDSLARQLDVTVTGLALTDARTRWGSCTSQGVIRLNWRLIKSPPDIIDYVVAHELAHIVELNHSPAFWRVVAGLCPDYRQRRALLKLHGASYHDF